MVELCELTYKWSLQIGDQLEDVAMQVLEEELSPPSRQGNEVTLRAQVCSEDVPRMNRELFDDINSIEQYRKIYYSDTKRYIMQYKYFLYFLYIH